MTVIERLARDRHAEPSSLAAELRDIAELPGTDDVLRQRLLRASLQAWQIEQALDEVVENARQDAEQEMRAAQQHRVAMTMAINAGRVVPMMRGWR